jgi:hypothetical protein
VTTRFAILSSAILLAATLSLQAQTTTTSKEAGTAQVVTAVLTGEVVWIDGNMLVAKLRPSGEYRVYKMQPGQKFQIDGQSKLISELKLGTVLTATSVTTTQPITVRTTTVVNGTVVWVNGNYVVLLLPSGDDKGYTVPENFPFTVDGKTVTVRELKTGTKVTATKIVEDPHVEVVKTTIIMGTVK